MTSFITDHQRIGKIIAAEVPFKTRRAITISLALERLGEYDQDFIALKDLIKRSAALEQKRNAVVHCAWLAGNSTDTATRFKTTAREGRGLHFQFDSVDESQLAQLGHDLRALSEEFLNFGVGLIQKRKAVNNNAQGTARWPEDT